MGSPSGHARLDDLCAALETGLARAGEDLELVLELARLPESVVVGVEGRPAQPDSAAQDIAGGGV